MEEEGLCNDEQNLENNGENLLYGVKGMDLVLTSLNCEKYKPVLEKHGINEHTMVYLTENDLEHVNVDNKDVKAIVTAVKTLDKTQNLTETQLSNDEIQRLQSTINGQLGSIIIILNRIHDSIANDTKHFSDMLIDNYLSSVDAALMVKPFMRAEEKEIEKTLKNVYKIKKRRSTMSIVTTVCLVCLFGIALKRSNYSFNHTPALPNFIHQIKNWGLSIF